MSFDFSKYPLPKRYRHHVTPYSYFPFDENIPHKENYPPLYESINWKEHFDNKKSPNVLDIGSAFGRYTIKYAIENPNDNVLGIEVRKGPLDWMNSVVESEEMGNISGIWYSVVNRLDFLESNSIDKIFYFFPDPWFKSKHQKRRAFQMPMVEDCYRILKDDGTLFLQTDIEDVNEYHKELLEESKLFNYSVPDKWDLPTTDKEEHCIRKGFEYWRLVCKKK